MDETQQRHRFTPDVNDLNFIQNFKNKTCFIQFVSTTTNLQPAPGLTWIFLFRLFSSSSSSSFSRLLLCFFQGGASCFYLDFTPRKEVDSWIKSCRCDRTKHSDRRFHSMSNQPRSNRGHRDRNGDNRRYRDSHDDRRSSPDRSSSQPPYYPRDRHSPQKHGREAPRVEHHDSKCTHICSRRGIILICAVLTNILVLICLVAAHMVTSGMSTQGAVSGFNINSNFNLQGTELQKVRELDMQYSQMRAPGLYGGLPFSLTFAVVSLLFVISANKPPHLLSRKLLVASLLFQAVGGVAYVVAVGLFLHFIIGVNATEICQSRARLYARNGYTWMSCDVSGADAAVALFGLITAILYLVGTVFTFKTIRGVKRYLQELKRREAERQKTRDQPPRAPLRAETTFV